MLTREEIIEIEQYCSEHKVCKKERLAELGIAFWNFYKARQKYQKEDESVSAGKGRQEAGFIQLSSGEFGPLMSARRKAMKLATPKEEVSSVESCLTIGLKTMTGTAMRIQGNMTAQHLRELISGAGGHV